MNQGKTILELEQATSVPSGTEYIAEMGDGSGTKRVTHEVVIQAVADALPLGDTKDLETTAQDTFVNAINEIKQRTDNVLVGAVVKVTTEDPGLYGQTVTVTDGETSLTGTMSYSGACAIAGVTMAGELTVSAYTADGEYAEAIITVTAYATYTVNIDSRSNFLNVATDEGSLFGQAVTVTNGTETATGAFDSAGEARIGFTFSGTVTVTATDGENSGKGALTVIAGAYSYEATLKLGAVYSALLDLSNSSPDAIVTYSDDAEGMEKDFSSWRGQKIFKDLQPCVVRDGEVLYYLDPGNYALQADGETAADITTAGNDVMLEIPMRLGYLIEWQDEGKTKLKVSVTNVPDDENYNYDAFSLDSYNDCDKIYIGAYKGYCTDGKAYSISGMTPTASQAIGTFRDRCRARGDGYQQRTYGSLKLMQCLYIISHGTLDSQGAVGFGYSLSTHTAGAKTGGADAYGFDSEVIRASDPDYMTDRDHQVKCLGLEDFWGNYWEYIDGL